jgi:hypothetical protein
MKQTISQMSLNNEEPSTKTMFTQWKPSQTNIFSGSGSVLKPPTLGSETLGSGTLGSGTLGSGTLGNRWQNSWSSGGLFPSYSVPKKPTLLSFGMPLDQLTNKTAGIIFSGIIGQMAGANNSKLNTSEEIAFAKHLINNKTITGADPALKLSQIAPFVIANMSEEETKQQLETVFKAKNSQDVAVLFVLLLRQLIVGKFHTAQEICNFCTQFATSVDNRRLRVTIKLLEACLEKKQLPENPFVTERDCIDCFAAALFHFLTTDGNPLNAMKNALESGYHPEIVGKLVGNMVGAEYGSQWIPHNLLVMENIEELKEISISLAKEFSV